MKIYTFMVLISTCALLSACSYSVENQNIATDINGSNAVSALPYKIEVQSPENFDKEVMILGIMCRAHKYTPAISKDIARLSNPDSSNTRTVIAKSASHTAKCVMTAPVQGKCQSDINIEGSIIEANGRSKNFNISKRVVESTTACEGLNNSIRQATAEAITELVNKF